MLTNCSFFRYIKRISGLPRKCFAVTKLCFFQTKIRVYSCKFICNDYSIRSPRKCSAFPRCPFGSCSLFRKMTASQSRSSASSKRKYECTLANSFATHTRIFVYFAQIHIHAIRSSLQASLPGLQPSANRPLRSNHRLKFHSNDGSSA